MTETEKYVRRYLSSELAKVESSPIVRVQNGLDIYERTPIYYYTASGYRSINASLRRSAGKRGNKASQLLLGTLEKLPDWRGLTFRHAEVMKKGIGRYRQGLDTGIPITEPTFISASRSSGKIRYYPHSNTEFQIFSLHGKSIEKYSCLGLYMPPNEEEILFGPGHSFEVIEVNHSGPLMLIVLSEIES